MRKRRIQKYSGNQSSKSILRRRNRGVRILQKSGEVLPMTTENVLIDRLSGIFKQSGFRAGKYLHVSDLIKTCLRKIAISYKTNTEMVGETFYDNIGITFAIGNSIADYVTEKVIRNHAEEMYGIWHCRCGESKIEGVFTQAAEHGDCPECGGALTNYGELFLPSSKFSLSGSVDLCLSFGGALYITELKSIKGDAWKEMERPLPDHILQVMFYWWLAKELGYDLHSQVSILYVTKAHVFKSPYKEFTLDVEKYIKRIDPYLEEALELKESRAGGKIPVRICPTIESPQASRCSLSSLCFSWKDDLDKN